MSKEIIPPTATGGRRWESDSHNCWYLYDPAMPEPISFVFFDCEATPNVWVGCVYPYGFRAPRDEDTEFISSDADLMKVLNDVVRWWAGRKIRRS